MSLIELIPVIKKGLFQVLEQIITNKQDVAKLEAVSTTLDWYKEAAEQSMDFSSLSNKIASTIIDNVIEPMVKPLFEDIQLKIQGNDVEVSFNTGRFTSELKPYVEFVKKINNVDIAKIKIKFQINSDLQIKDMQVKHVKKNTTVNFGNLEGSINMSIISINTSLANYEEAISLGSKSFSFPLPSISI
ncbi:MAG: hypothetical protein WEC35_06200 [Nitrosopumilaceae archaeon]